MIDVRCLFKTGRDVQTKTKKETKVFAVSENLDVNEFYYECGYTNASIHSKYSRIKFNIIDTSAGAKDKAKVVIFNFKPFEWRMISRRLSLNGQTFNDKIKKINEIRCNPYKKIGDKVEVKIITITFEVGLKIPKWKIVIENGKATPNKNGDIGYESKTYEKITELSFMLSENEKEEMLLKVNSFLNLWEEYNFSIFIKNREQFIKRASANNYDESTMDQWNSKYSSNTENVDSNNNSFKNSNISRNRKTNQKFVNQGNNQNAKYFCTRCRKEISKIIHDKTLKVQGESLCPECMQKELQKEITKGANL